MTDSVSHVTVSQTVAKRVIQKTGYFRISLSNVSKASPNVAMFEFNPLLKGLIKAVAKRQKLPLSFITLSLLDVLIVKTIVI